MLCEQWNLPASLFPLVSHEESVDSNILLKAKAIATTCGFSSCLEKYLTSEDVKILIGMDNDLFKIATLLSPSVLEIENCISGMKNRKREYTCPIPNYSRFPKAVPEDYNILLKCIMLSATNTQISNNRDSLTIPPSKLASLSEIENQFDNGISYTEDSVAQSAIHISQYYIDDGEYLDIEKLRADFINLTFIHE